MRFVTRVSFVGIVALLTIAAADVLAAPAWQLRQGLIQELQRPRAAGEKIVLRNIDLGREGLDTIELEPVRVWAPDAEIRVWGPTGVPTRMKVPEYQNFKGRVVGEDESIVFLSYRKGRLVGTIVIGVEKFSFGTAYPVRNRQPRYQDPDVDLTGESLPVLIGRIDDMESVGEPAADWSCEYEGDGRFERPVTLEPRPLKAAPEAGGVSGASYTLRIALDTDNELCAGFGNDATSVTNYMNDLIAKSNIIYERDVNTTLVIGSLEIRNGGDGTDPWTATSGTSAALYEFGTYWHNTPPSNTTPRSAVSFITGKSFFGGVAWRDVLCSTDFYCGDTGANCGDAASAGKWGGPYSVVGSLSSVSTTNADPTTTIDGHEYAMPNANNFWILAAFTHELGHTVASKHTNCYPSGGFTTQQKTTYGIGTTSLPDRSYVDTCLNSGTGCYNGGTTEFPTEWGTIMSYCHNKSDNGNRASRFIFGKTGEASELLLPVMSGGVDAATPDGTITIGSSPIACSAGQTASVPNAANRTYAWEITGGTITSATNTNSITFTPTAQNVTVTVTVTNTSSNHGCSIKTSATRETSCSPISAPTNLVATAATSTSVSLTWDSVGGATSYKVFRSSNGTTYSQVGTPSSNSYTDSTASADTAYLYKVKANDGSSDSGDSNIDLATTVIFTDPTLTVGATKVKAAHITELRTAVNAVRTLASLSSSSFTDATLTAGSTMAKRLHVTELRTALDAARSALSLTSVTYTDSTITAGSTPIKAAHINDLRGGVK